MIVAAVVCVSVTVSDAAVFGLCAHGDASASAAAAGATLGGWRNVARVDVAQFQ